MKKILLEERYILEYIKDMINDFKYCQAQIGNAKYHHNSSYEWAPSICRYGILTIEDISKLNLRIFSEKYMKVAGDIESHANGTEAVSLSIVGMTDLYPDEFEYDPINPYRVDFLVSSDIKTDRFTVNYGNEFLSHSSIAVDKLRAVDIRMLNLIKMFEENVKRYGLKKDELIKNYNKLIEIAMVMEHANLNIPLREMSYEDGDLLDICKLSKTPGIKVISR